ncbi:hypothetical protein PUNSTDRAFT_74230 [Punctularia strigosozonata HHB-11173 SS5]|uniref:uncharacterized protein n=1 Tax=Punctularia strigosozonata (strain HHB-11173) TaxID=741275 RepID=UPI00044168C7|nr:uncharacterized protein PUNSTDRAFT_74230 [Punctularia strigosozonata HHB-11173 SS5]EIN05662.1 hypothetical protein PUNSTDRAFT_74230 [Punctularia strigosozonata HHB-11173 SS5]
MVEAEAHCNSRDPRKERLYYATGYGLIQCVKALMSYEDEDIERALGHVRTGNAVAQAHRKRPTSFAGRLAGYVVGSSVKAMTPVERHAELVFAESTFEKALLGIVYSGDWLAFIKEALKMRTCVSIYRTLGKFIDAADAADPAGFDAGIDAHFRSGVYLGLGAMNLILSMMPNRLQSLVELFGYSGNRLEGLRLLEKAGGWSADSDEPAIGQAEEGVRRPICDMTLLIFHLVLSSFTYLGVSTPMASKILAYHLRRFPHGVFFLFGAGRLALRKAQPAKALRYYKQAMDAQNQMRNLHLISYWEMAVAHLSLWDVRESLACWRTLEQEGTWSKACYTYGAAVCLLQLGGDDNREEAAKLMDKVPKLRQRLAGKSIPLEKFVARKARKFSQQLGRLLLPALEFGYLFLTPAHAPASVLRARVIPTLDAALAGVLPYATDEKRRAEYEEREGKDSLWDDLCLARFLEGVCCRYVAWPDPDAEPEEGEETVGEKEEGEMARRAEAALNEVLKHGGKIVYDHHLVYHAHYELGRLLACKGDRDGARRHLELVLSGKPLEASAAARKGKYSMQNALEMRTHAALESLDLAKGS